MTNKTLLKSFAGGEITPELNGRLDLTKYQTGLALARNFITLPHGPAARRPGTRFINEAKDSTRKVRLIPFQFSATQTAVLEFGHQYIRFHVNAGTVLEATKAITSIAGSTVTITAHGYLNGDWVYIGNRFFKVASSATNTFTTTDLWDGAVTSSGATAARAYTVDTPYQEADLFMLAFAQNADVISITHPAYAAREISRLAAASWTLTVIDFAPPTVAPPSLVVTTTIAQNQNLSPQSYVVTAVQSDGVTESLPSARVTVNNNLSLAGNYNTITWGAIAGATRYNVFKLRGGIFGYIGQIIPDTSSGSTITSITRVNYVTTVTTSTAHGFTAGQIIYISGTGVPSLNGSYTLASVTNSTTFVLTLVYYGNFYFYGLYSGNASASIGFATNTTSGALSIKDDNVLPDTLTPPPDDIITLNKEASDYPAAVTYHEQRRWFAGSDGKPQVLWGTRTGTESNLTSSIPSRDADAMELKIAATQYNRIRHLVALSDLIAFTAGGEFRIFADGAPAITPTSVSIKPQGYSGSAAVQPVLTSSSILYVQAQGARVRELAYNWEANSYKTVDVSILAPHRFNGHTITQLAYSRAPDQILWAVRDDGVLLGLTYVPDQQVFGWHAHDTDGLVESVCVVSEGNEDVLYMVVKRTVLARTVRYIERLQNRIFVDQADAYFVDAGLTYDSTPTTTVTGLWHLNNQTVHILADGAVETPAVVTNGSVTIGTAASVIHVGLPITAELQTLPLALEGAQAVGQGTVKNVNKVHLRVVQSSLVQAGPSFTRLRAYPARAISDNYGSPPGLRAGEITLSIDPAWSQDAAICIRQDEPLPLTITSMTLEMQAGG